MMKYNLKTGQFEDDSRSTIMADTLVNTGVDTTVRQQPYSMPNNGLAISSINTRNKTPLVGSDGLGSYGTYVNPTTGEEVGVNKDAFDAMSSVGTDGVTKNVGVWGSIKNSFTPEGTSGRSYAGNLMDTIGTGVGIGTGLAGAYYTKKNFDLQKENQDYLKGREAKADARSAQFAANAGNGASYKY